MVRDSRFKPTAAEARAMRTEYNALSLMEAKAILTGRKLRDACRSPWIEDARVAEILLQIVNDHYPADPEN